MTRCHYFDPSPLHLEEALFRYWIVSAQHRTACTAAPRRFHDPVGKATSASSLTQPATVIASVFSWSIDPGGSLLDSAGCFIAMSLNDSMIAMLDLRWIDILSLKPRWDVIPTDEEEAANDVRVFLDVDGTAYTDPFPMR